MTYQESIDYLFSRLPMFQRIGAAAYKANLDNTYAIDEILNHPHTQFKTIHIAGTNGKGSTSHYLASIFQEAGYKTGLYTSPHLIDFRERIRVNGEMISKNYITYFIEKYRIDFEKIEPSFFEWTVGLAFKYFEESQVDVAIIETGLGGRLDSTNIINPVLSIITNISYDHKQFLGDTLEKIASEKAGIIKKNVPIVIGESSINTKQVFLEKANSTNSQIYFADEDIAVLRLSDVKSELLTINIFENNELIVEDLNSELVGDYQLKNIATVYKSYSLLKENFGKLNLQTFSRGINLVIKNTSLHGRWQTISNNPKTICDTGHNLAGIAFVLQQLEKYGLNNICFVLGFVNDKELNEVLELLPKEAKYYFCEPSIPRALKIEDLKSKSYSYFPSANYYPSVQLALLDAQRNCKKNEIVFVGGSTFVVADALNSLQ